MLFVDQVGQNSSDCSQFVSIRIFDVQAKWLE